MIDWTKVTNNKQVIELIKKRAAIEYQILELDDMALVKYEALMLQELTILNYPPMPEAKG